MPRANSPRQFYNNDFMIEKIPDSVKKTYNRS